jgi:hypothetical protein
MFQHTTWRWRAAPAHKMSVRARGGGSTAGATTDGVVQIRKRDLWDR